MPVRAIKLHRNDNVASVLARVEAGEEIEVQVSDQEPLALVATEQIPFGHKVALAELEPETLVLKYGAPIGRVTKPISRGAHVHVHNVVGLAGTGRLGEEIRPVSSVTSPRCAHYRDADLRRWIRTVASTSGVSAEAAHDLAEAIVEAELNGIKTHGLRRLTSYLDRIAAGGIDGRAVPVLTGAGPIVEVDGRHGLGAHVLRVACDAAAERADQNGIGLGLVRNGSHAGAIGWCATRLAQRGLVGVVISNGPPLIAPPGGSRPFLSNSPLAIAAPVADGGTFLVDLATSVTSRDNIRQAAEAGGHIPPDWALDEEGKPTTDADSALVGTMLPIGGDRGFALVLGLEVLAGLLPGALSDRLVPSKDLGNAHEGIGHFVLAISPAHLAHGVSLARRLQDLEERMTALDRPEGAPVPRLPGRRRQKIREQRIRDGIPVPGRLEQELRALGDKLNVPFPESAGA